MIVNRYAYETEHSNGTVELMWCLVHEGPVVMYDDGSFTCMWDDSCWGLDCEGDGNVPIPLDQRFPENPDPVCTYEGRVKLGYSVCHEMSGGTMQLCDECYAQAQADYPQGWRGYPGDTCKHGVYTGGCGIDWMCGPCEMGEE
jgi:hypothetical protein